jgi:hypothetical protein
MKVALITLAVLLVAAVICYLVLFPENTFITLSRPGGRSVTFSRTSIALESVPDEYPTNGFAQVPSYMAQLRSSRKKRASVIISTTDGQNALLVVRDGGQMVLSVSADRTKPTGEEAKMREFFSKLCMAPIRDYLSDNGGVKDATRTCHYALPDDLQAVANLCISVFTNLFGATDEHGLRFSTHERD